MMVNMRTLGREDPAGCPHDERTAEGSSALQRNSAASSADPADPLADTAHFWQAELDTLRSINARLLREIEILKQREAHALMLADRDGLTGLYNRRRMSELLEQAVAEATQSHQRFAVLFIDLDGFKRINDHFGHTLGDELLTTVAGRIATRARTGDIVCRFGGDEFIVILPCVPSRTAAEDVASAIAGRIGLPYRLCGEELRITAAVGLSMFPQDGRSAAELLRRADQLMYRAKSTAPHDAQGDAGPARAHPARRWDDQPERDARW